MDRGIGLIWAVKLKRVNPRRLGRPKARFEAFFVSLFRFSVIGIALALALPIAAAVATDNDLLAKLKFYVKRGQDDFKAGNVDQALVDFQAASNVDLNSILPYQKLADVEYFDGDYEGAIKHWTRVLDLLQAILDKQSTPEAVEFDKTIRSVTLSDRAAAYEATNRFSLGIQDCERAISIKSTEASFHSACGRNYSGQGNYERALQYYNQALALDPNAGYALAHRGRTYFKMGRYDDALADCTKALELQPHSGTALLCLGEVYKAQGNNSAAIKNYQAARDILPFSKHARKALAELTNNPLLKEDRVALVIGNDAYKDNPLYSAVNDANDVANTLTKLGFAVIKNSDVNIYAMNVMFERFARKAKNADVALVFFSGHGGQYKEANYLVPVENNFQWNGEGAFGFQQYINLQGKVDALKNVGRTRILIVDACRTGESFESLEQRYGSDSKPTDAVEGMFIAYASAPDHYSYDGGRYNRNSPFTTALLNNLTLPGLEMRDLFTRVRREAYSNSGKKQLSQAWDNMPSEFSFFPSGAQLLELPAVSATTASASIVDGKVIELASGTPPASVVSAPPASLPPPTSPANLFATYNFHDNRDLYADDLDVLRGVQRDECQAACTRNQACEGFSYNKWKQACFLKNNIRESRLEPASVSGVKSPMTFPAEVDDIAETSLYHNRAFSGPGLRDFNAFSSESCQSECSQSGACVAFNFYTTQGLCRFFKSVSEVSQPTRSVDSGVKAQRFVKP